MEKKAIGNFVVCLLFLVCFYESSAQNPPAGFASVKVSSLWTEAVGIAFTEDGTEMFVWERPGRVWLEKNNQRTLILDISEEVGGFADHGLLGFALHPHFDENGYFYLLYVVDRHHLINYGTGAYNPLTNDYYKPTIGRLTRYTATKTLNGYNVSPSSRKVLIGATKTTGIIETSGTHGVGTLLFGTDHTLLVSVGDGASPYAGDVGSLALSNFQQALDDGIMTPTENVGVFRSQLLNTLSGKILRIDPETGAGIPSNPYYDPTRPDAPISKVWTVGVRNPFRISLKPGTGSHLASDGDPGVLYVGDVGWNFWEELSVVDKPGLNLGWPIYEGLDVVSYQGYAAQLTLNRDAPNPLYQVNGCTQQYFYFQDLLKQATPNGTATFTNPCNPTLNIPSSVPTFVHTRPLIDWHHGPTPTTRTGTFSGNSATIVNIGAGSPVAGTPFVGSSSIGGVLYTGTDFPQEYHNTYFFGDYSGSWIRRMIFDANNKPIEVKNFIDNNTSVVFMTTHPTEEGLYYVNYGSEIRKITYSANRPPVARASVDHLFGPTPLNTQFTGNTSTDPENLPLAYEWNFGDGSPISTLANPAHSFTAPPGTPTKYIVKLKVTDNQGVFDETTLTISVNNTPPEVTITSPIDNGFYPMTQETTYPMQATVTDQEHSQAQLTYQWQTFLHHETHMHPEPLSSAVETSTTVSPLGCDGQSYYYRIVLTVTDPAGGSTTREAKLYPDCNGNGIATPLINWSNPAPIISGTALSGTQLNATATHNGSTVPGTLTYTPPSGTVLATGNNQQLSVSFLPTDLLVYSPANKTVSINVLPGGNEPPVVALPVQDQNAIVGAPFNFMVPSNTFTDPNPGTIFTYSANLSTGGALPSWLSFNATTHTFSGTPGAADVGTIGVRVTAFDGVGGSTNDVFALTVNATGGAGTFYRAINVNGPALVVDGHNWEASATAPNYTYTTNQKGFVNQAVTLIPATDANRSTMIRSSIYGSNMTFTLTVPNGSYQVWIYVWEDNFAQTFSVSLEGSVVQSNYNSGPPGTWKKLGPFLAAINDGMINIASTGQDANFSGIEIWNMSAPPANQPPVVSIPLVDEVTTAGIPFNYTFPANTFSDPDPGTVLTYSSALSNGNVLPAWLNFNTNTRSFSGTPATNDVGILDIRVTASDGAGGSISDVYALTINSIIKVTPLITWANPASISEGTALGATQLNATASYNGSPVAGTMTYTPPAGTMLGVGNGQQLSVSFAPTNTTLYDVVSKTVTINVTEFVKLTPLITWANPAAITVGTSLSGTQLNAAVTFNGSPVAGTLTYTPPSGTVLGLGTWQSLSVNFVPTNTSLYNTASKSVLIDVNPLPKVTPLITWANPAPITTGTPLSSVQLNATASVNGTPVAGTFIYTPGAGIVLNIGTAQVLSVTFDPDNTAQYNSVVKTATIDVNPIAPATSFYRAINVNGPALVIDGNNWQASAGAANFSSTTDRGPMQNQAVPLLPPTDANRATMIRSSIWGVNVNLIMNVPAGNYSVFLYVWEDNSPAVFSVAVEGSTVLSNYNSGPGGTWKKLGPYPVTINDGAINVTAFGGHANVSGLEVWSVSQAPANQPPVVSQPIPDQSATIGSAFNFIFSANTFSDPNAGTVLSYASTLPNGSALPAWLSFSPAARSFTGTPAAADAGAVDIRVTALDGAGGMVSDVFTLTVIPLVKFTPLINWSNPVPITTGTVLGATQLNATATNNGIPVAGTFIYTPSAGTILPIGNAHLLSVFFTPTNTTLYNSANKSVTIDVTATPKVTPLITWANPAPITSGTPLSATQLNATATVNGSAVAGTLTYTPPSGTVLGVGQGQILSVNFVPTNSTLYNPVSKTVTINVNAIPVVSFYRGINLNGPALVIDGNNWQASVGAPNFTYTTDRGVFQNQAVTLIPATDANRATMIRSSIWGVNVNLTLSVPTGNYQVFLYVWEDNTPAVFSVAVEGSVVQPNFNSGSAGTWKKLGPFPVTISDGAINVSATGGHANLSGLEVHTVSQPGAREATEASEALITATKMVEDQGLKLSAFPNPFSKSVHIEFTALESGITELSMYDTRGIQIRQLYKGNMLAGSSEQLVVEAGDLTDGVYVLRLMNGTKVGYFKLAIAR